MDIDSKIFVVYKAIRKQKKIPIYLEKQVQIEAKAQIGVLLFNKISIIFLVIYFDYSNIFSIKNTIKLSKYTKINNHAIKFKK